MSKRGRPVGSLSTIRVKMSDLSQYLTPQATVVVGTEWLKSIGFGIEQADIKTLKVVKETPENTVVEVKDLV